MLVQFFNGKAKHYKRLAMDAYRRDWHSPIAKKYSIASQRFYTLKNVFQNVSLLIRLLFKPNTVNYQSQRFERIGESVSYWRTDPSKFAFINDWYKAVLRDSAYYDLVEINNSHLPLPLTWTVNQILLIRRTGTKKTRQNYWS